MKFSDLLRQYLALRDRQNADEDNRPIAVREAEFVRMCELETLMNEMIGDRK